MTDYTPIDYAKELCRELEEKSVELMTLRKSLEKTEQEKIELALRVEKLKADWRDVEHDLFHAKEEVLFYQTLAARDKKILEIAQSSAEIMKNHAQVMREQRDIANKQVKDAQKQCERLQMMLDCRNK